MTISEQGPENQAKCSTLQKYLSRHIENFDEENTPIPSSLELASGFYYDIYQLIDFAKKENWPERFQYAPYNEVLKYSRENKGKILELVKPFFNWTEIKEVEEKAINLAELGLPIKVPLWFNDNKFGDRSIPIGVIDSEIAEELAEIAYCIDIGFEEIIPNVPKKKDKNTDGVKPRESESTVAYKNRTILYATLNYYGITDITYQIPQSYLSSNLLFMEGIPDEYKSGFRLFSEDEFEDDWSRIEFIVAHHPERTVKIAHELWAQGRVYDLIQFLNYSETFLNETDLVNIGREMLKANVQVQEISSFYRTIVEIQERITNGYPKDPKVIPGKVRNMIDKISC